MLHSKHIRTILGNPSVLGPETRWNVDEMIDVIKANPQADRPMGAMTKEWHQADTRDIFPSNQAVFDERLKTAMEPLTRPKVAGWNNITIEYYETTEEEADQFLVMIDSLTGSSGTDTVIMNIILETAQDYFNGRHSSEDAVRIIQNRVGIYVSEQVG